MDDEFVTGLPRFFVGNLRSCWVSGVREPKKKNQPPTALPCLKTLGAPAGPRNKIGWDMQLSQRHSWDLPLAVSRMFIELPTRSIYGDWGMDQLILWVNYNNSLT